MKSAGAILQVGCASPGSHWQALRAYSHPAQTKLRHAPRGRFLPEPHVALGIALQSPRAAAAATPVRCKAFHSCRCLVSCGSSMVSRPSFAHTFEKILALRTLAHDPLALLLFCKRNEITDVF